MLLVLGVIGAGSLAFRRFVQGKGLPFQRQGKVIEMVSTQTLGPKRSIALVKVLDRHLVIGMAGDSINLLVDMGTDVNLEKYMDDSPSGASFSDALTLTMASPGSSSSSNLDKVKPSESDRTGFRANLKKRIEGLKPL